jgi:hypothetical protein
MFRDLRALRFRYKERDVSAVLDEIAPTTSGSTRKLNALASEMAKAYQLGPGLRAYNALMKPLVRLGIGGKSTYLLTTTACRSGRRHEDLLRTRPVIRHRKDLMAISS